MMEIDPTYVPRGGMYDVSLYISQLLYSVDTYVVDITLYKSPYLFHFNRSLVLCFSLLYNGVFTIQ